MAVFHCGRFPHGNVPIRTTAGMVVFVDGQAAVDDPEQAQALREVPPVFEITEDVEAGGDHGPAPSTPGRRPAQSASKVDWAAWAVRHGMSAEQADDLTKAQLIALADELDKE
ncbi:hypothetical protein FXF51_56795 [Nonomuraea sp. PA05]|uniref:hypothetical protein n=1 Tax=Nonomuraea sp. PA05 TaxID=2604466 RepID=UPI0011D74016|nr:hypothetical protein [Nonomuraea sp. PA05]TYB50241.1 hypothetical protein FXF51_56795 [Nonomuraea sp. PA05]